MIHECFIYQGTEIPLTLIGCLLQCLVNTSICVCVRERTHTYTHICCCT